MSIKSDPYPFDAPHERDALSAILRHKGLAESAPSEPKEYQTNDADMLIDIITDYRAALQSRYKPNGKHSDDKDDQDDFSVKLSMADAMIEILKENGECYAADLARKGFTLGEIARCWDMAAALATIELAEENDDIVASSLLIA